MNLCEVCISWTIFIDFTFTISFDIETEKLAIWKYKWKYEKIWDSTRKKRLYSSRGRWQLTHIWLNSHFTRGCLRGKAKTPPKIITNNICSSKEFKSPKLIQFVKNSLSLIESKWCIGMLLLSYRKQSCGLLSDSFEFF